MPNEPITDDDETNVDDDQQTPPVETVVQPAVHAVEEATEDDEEFGRMTQRERTLVQKARTQEKAKLYGRVTQLQTELSALKRVSVTPVVSSGNGNGNSRQQRDAEIAQLQTSVNSLSESIRQGEERTRQRELRDYKRERMAETRARNIGFIDAMVTGDSEEMIDSTLAAAIAEAAYQKTLFQQEYGVTEPVGPGGRPRTTVVVRQSAPRQPEGVPSVVGAGSGGSDSNVLTTAELNDLTSDAAIRSGKYAANRDRIQQALRTNAVR